MRRALILGIDDYPGTPLQGCVADAEEMDRLLSRNQDGSLNYDVVRRTSSESTLDRPAVRQLLDEFFDNAGQAQLLFYFAGHGRPGDVGAGLVTQDLDDVAMDDLINKANASPAPEVVLIIDCCFSGDLGNTPSLQASSTAAGFRFGKVLLREGVTVLAASRPTEPSAESNGHGEFTRILIEGLEGAAADHLGHVTPHSLYAFASRAFGAWDQRPVLKAYVNESSPLRTCHPWIEPALLRALPEWFPDPTFRYSMTPEHEGTRPIPEGVEPTEEQETFDYFKALRNAGLLTTDNEKDLYFVSLDSEEVYLTPLGQYFCRLALEKRL